MLSSIKRYLEERGTASLADIARHVDADAGAVEGMVAVWIRKGRVSELPLACGGCADCDPATIKLYRWLDPIAP